MNAPNQVGRVIAIVLLVYMGQMSLNPVIAPLAREVGLAEWQVGLTISTAAIMVVATSQFWGRRAQTSGARKVLVRAVGITVLAMVAFTVTAWAGMAAGLPVALTFALFLLLRGVLFGGGIAAVPPTAQTYVARATSTEQERIKGMSGIGAAQGVAMVLGAVLGGLLAGISLLVSLIAVPVLLLVALGLALLLPKQAAGGESIESPRVRVTDRRIWPFLLSGFGMFTALGFIQVITGFLVLDRFGLAPESAGLATGGALLVAGAAMVVAQAIVVPRSGWSPTQLLRIGSSVALVGFLLFLPNIGAIPFVVAIGLIGFGLGVATPGYVAGATLQVEPEEQGGLAGVVGMNNGLTFVLAPSLSTFAYGVAPELPIAIAAVIMAGVLLFVWLHPGVRRMPSQPAMAKDDIRQASQ